MLSVFFFLLQAALKAKELLVKHSNKPVVVDLIHTDSISVITMFCGDVCICVICKQFAILFRC